MVLPVCACHVRGGNALRRESRDFRDKFLCHPYDKWARHPHFICLSVMRTTVSLNCPTYVLATLQKPYEGTYLVALEAPFRGTLRSG